MVSFKKKKKKEKKEKKTLTARRGIPDVKTPSPLALGRNYTVRNDFMLIEMKMVWLAMSTRQDLWSWQPDSIKMIGASRSAVRTRG